MKYIETLSLRTFFHNNIDISVNCTWKDLIPSINFMLPDEYASSL